jgi:hypothetical protein
VLQADHEKTNGARAYLNNRGFLDDHQRDLAVGYYPSVARLREKLIEVGHTDADIREARVLTEKMVGYIVFPWVDERGQPVTLYGTYPDRKPPDDIPKKMGLPNPKEKGEDWLQTKGAPYCLNRALRDGHKHLVCVEGITDAALAQAMGDTRVIACAAGTLAYEQIETLKRVGIESVTVALDPDTAGDANTRGTIRHLFGAGITAYVAARLPDGMDPDDFIAARGIDTWKAQVEQRQHGFSWLAQAIIKAHGPRQPGDDDAYSVGLIEQVIAEAKELPRDRPDELTRYLFRPVAELTGCRVEDLHERLKACAPPPAPAHRPEILIHTKRAEVNNEAIAALTADPTLYQRGHMLVRVLRDEGSRKRIVSRPHRSPVITPLPAATLGERLTVVADWKKDVMRKNGDIVRVAAHPPGWTISGVSERGTWEGIRHLEGVVEAPTLRPDGSILDRPGFDEATGLLYEPSVAFEPIEEWVELAAAQAHAAAILELLDDFPFAGCEHKAAWLAGLLSPLARFAFSGPCPLFMLEASAAGSGKSMLGDIIAIITTGRNMARGSYPEDDDTEMRKAITSIALAGDRLIMFDNIAEGGIFGCAALDRALTGETWKDRILGRSEMTPELPLHTVFYATGNNVGMKGDTHRRIIPIRLQPDVEKPEERDDFKIPDLLAHVRQHRGCLIARALSILRAFACAGFPQAKLIPFGSYEGWSRVVRQAVVWATGDDPCATRKGLLPSDRGTDSLLGLLDGWAALPGGTDAAGGVTAADALAMLVPASISAPQPYPALNATLRSLTKNNQLPSSRVLAGRLRTARGRVVNGRAMESRQGGGGNQCWYVRRISTPAGG